ncbi:class II aldolase/adducin family protein [Paracoccus denitrificans]|jgi:ribulose-5-phosphate 4-epimerase/fuculose-1-phosphate aldolase|uniref:class II aldolase/adducin family protein n=1 Tax=Paracoccus denitrificans TaxID=266 RepID=UPI0000554C6A|nr:class II aldolase/adducin family protein [Paracoccus denitrificans]MBB4629281.1 ribulose-5-phosphate 4-epimerase/fuculose-1-phosphate aldolase [Paracoccus denitrificans]MCU7430300.1 class II aldolase/adducin family protein [Paracoccus denitrificans]SDJ40948.1 Hydantoinase B/oxoprolinase [Paracoccus denitrificans]SFR18206.1 Hydantoinase B/oxoprolinase [Paracoccus denitrificans]GEK69942.1 hypothetical protein PDE01_34620 [Paracoccus denitrificans]
MTNRIFARESIIDNLGHVSLHHPLHPDRYLLSRSRSPQNVTSDDIMEFTLDGEQVGDDPRTPYSERHIHGALYELRPDLNAVVHHHARPVLPFTILDIPLRPVFHMAAVIGNRRPVWESQHEFGDTNMLVDSMDMGLSLARSMGQGNSVLMRMMNDAEHRLRHKLEHAPDGAWSASSDLEQSGVGDRSVHRIALTMTKKGGHLTFDFTGTDPQAGVINCTHAGSRGGVMVALLPILAGDIPWAAGGILRLLHDHALGHIGADGHGDLDLGHGDGAEPGPCRRASRQYRA